MKYVNDKVNKLYVIDEQGKIIQHPGDDPDPDKSQSPESPKPGAIWLRQYSDNKVKGNKNNNSLFYQCLLFKKVDLIKIETQHDDNKAFKINKRFSKNIINIYFNSDKNKDHKKLIEY